MALHDRLLLLFLLSFVVGSSVAAAPAARGLRPRYSILSSSASRSATPRTSRAFATRSTSRVSSTTQATTLTTPTESPKASCVKHVEGSFHYYIVWGIEYWSYSFSQLVSEFKTQANTKCDLQTFSSEADIPTYGDAMVFDVNRENDGCIESLFKALGAPKNVCPSTATNPTGAWWQMADNVQSSNVTDILVHAVNEADGNQDGTPRATLDTHEFTSMLNSNTMEVWATATIAADASTTATVPLGTPTETFVRSDNSPSANCHEVFATDGLFGLYAITNISYWGSPVPSDAKFADVVSQLTSKLEDKKCTYSDLNSAEDVTGFGPSITLRLKTDTSDLNHERNCLNTAISDAGGPSSICSPSPHLFPHGVKNIDDTVYAIGHYLNEYNATGTGSETHSEYETNQLVLVSS